MGRKLFGIRCDVPARRRKPAEWQWLCLNGEPMLWYSMEDAQKARDQHAQLASWCTLKVPNGVTFTAMLYGIER